MPVLSVKNLVMHYRTKKGYVRAVDGVSFDVGVGEVLGIVGESGCGKTSISMAILRLLPENAEFRGGQVLFNNGNETVDLVGLADSAMQKYRWKGISMIFQSAMNSLNPVYRVGDQILEAMKRHYFEISKEAARKRVEELFRLVGLDPKRMRQYPHQYSGGMKQRAVIAMALACDPRLVIADEPTTALDVIVQDRIMRELKRIQKDLDMSMIYISHDIAVIAEVSDRVAIMYAGKLVELADTLTIFERPMHPYTNGLMNAFPNVVGQKRKLRTIQGEPPDLLNPPSGCRFAPRCSYADGRCKEADPEFRILEEGHYVACFHPVEKEGCLIKGVTESAE